MPLPRLPELLVILLIVVLIFGAGRLPQIAGSLGKSLHEFRRAFSGQEEKGLARTASRDGREP